MILVIQIAVGVFLANLLTTFVTIGVQLFLAHRRARRVPDEVRAAMEILTKQVQGADKPATTKAPGGQYL